jgi:hypothetical protein
MPFLIMHRIFRNNLQFPKKIDFLPRIVTISGMSLDLGFFLDVDSSSTRIAAANRKKWCMRSEESQSQNEINIFL